MASDYAPKGIFTGLPQSTLDELRQTALARITSGSFTSLSGGAKSSTREYDLTADQILEEVKHAERVASGRPRAARVNVDLRFRPSGL